MKTDKAVDSMTKEQLTEELQNKILTQFDNEQSYINYLLETKRNFLYRYLETTTDKEINITLNGSQFMATSFENNMGEAFKISDKEIKEGIKNLAKTVDRNLKPAVRYQLNTSIVDLKNGSGHIIIEAEVNWGFPNYEDLKSNYKRKKLDFKFADAAIFRKELAQYYERSCELFI